MSESCCAASGMGAFSWTGKLDVQNSRPNRQSNTGNSMVSLTHGRPAMVHDRLATEVPLPLVRAGGQDRPQLQLTEASFFVASIELYNISHRILQEFYGSPVSYRRRASSLERMGMDDELGIVMKLDSSLSNWQDGLPEHLSTSHPECSKNKVSHRQAIILQIRLDKSLLTSLALLFETCTDDWQDFCMLECFCFGQC